jgi:hypothetical protein
MHAQECCNGNCNQGRDCPLRKKDETLDTRSYLIGRYDTSPVKQLTDEEIQEVFYSLEVGHSASDFARAILRKAQEK